VAELDHEDANLVGEGRGSVDVRYGSDGSENGVRLDDRGVVECACWLSPSPVFSVFCPFPISMRSYGTEDSGTNGINSWEVEAEVFSITVSPAGCESGICTEFWISGEGWYEEAIAASSARACASTLFTLWSPKMEARAVWNPMGRGAGAITGVSAPVFEPRCTKHIVVQPSSSRTSGNVVPGRTVRARMLMPLFRHSEAWRMEDPAGRQPLRVMPKGDPGLMIRGEARPGPWEGEF